MFTKSFDVATSGFTSCSPFVSQFLLAGSYSSLFQPLHPCFQDLFCLLALLHDHPNVGLRCMLEIEILFNKLSLKLANFQSPPVGFASLQFAAQNQRLATTVVTLSSTSALTETTAPSKTTSAPMAADESTRYISSSY